MVFYITKVVSEWMRNDQIMSYLELVVKVCSRCNASTGSQRPGDWPENKWKATTSSSPSKGARITASINPSECTSDIL